MLWFRDLRDLNSTGRPSKRIKITAAPPLDCFGNIYGENVIELLGTKKIAETRLHNIYIVASKTVIQPFKS